ncbi:uncharacterized protein LOC105213072 [Zeugodacus cucurbitae]|uniref:uncharacterized protein LOC105213072 n=1 Tax=Zeugodacus cucurbitae TaxID=28588 RepID=UPI0010A7409D|nr:uncharacterized protein LOC105213072 [Zeugodacus cucurbitae]
MFFRRMFARKDNSGSGSNTAYDYDDDVNGNDNTDEQDEIGALGGVTARSKHYSNSNGNGVLSNGSGTNSSSDYELQQHRRNGLRKYGAATAPSGVSGAAKHCGSASTLHRAATSGPATVQLTPLWEHILRTRTLPDNVYPIKIFGEFLERLRDPEWQVRQHALRVFVDVLVVMRAEADAYMDPLIPRLVENLGHQAPTVRKGALDCLRVYLAETAMPETILLQILDIGLNQKITNEPFGGRLTCGVMLSLPALVQSTLHTSKRHYILRTAVEMLVQKMGQVTHQEITLKVLSKLRELVGEDEFREYMTKSAYREFDLLCNVYGVEGKLANSATRHGSGHVSQVYTNNAAGTWRMLSKQSGSSCWRSSDEEQMLEEAAKGKVIMETEVKINDDTLTMRILEAKDDDFDTEADTDSSPRKSLDTYPNSLEDEVVCGRLPSASHDLTHEISAVVRLLSDSELDLEEDLNVLEQLAHQHEKPEYYTVVTPSTPSRTPKRVTFGGEVVKMRTPDSDANNSNSTNNNGNGAANHTHSLFATNPGTQNAIDAGGGGSSDSSETVQRTITTTTTTTEITIISTPSTSAASSPVPEESYKTMALSVEITNDNTKPLPPVEPSPTARPRTASSPRRSQTPNNTADGGAATSATSNASTSTSTTTTNSQSPPKRRDSVGSAGTVATLSPRSPFKRLSVSPVDSIISPKTPHKPIEVMHNLQRDPSPVRARSARRAESMKNLAEAAESGEVAASALAKSTAAPRAQTPSPLPPKTWEELDIVDYDTLLDLRSGSWHHRLQGVAQLEEALRNSDTLAQVQPCLDSLLRTLLSSERNADVAEAKKQLLINLITRLPLDNLEDRTTQIMTGLCRQGGAGANRVCKALMHRLPAASIVLKLLSQEFLHAKSSRFREHALQMVMYALTTFPSTCFDTTTCVTQTTYAALNRKRRVRQAALDVLAILGQITTGRAVLDVVQDIASERDDGPALLSAVRTRLSRKQMPVVGADGQVQYALRVPSPHSAEAADAANGQMGADIEWIVAGVGSVSPGSLKRRGSRRSFRCLPTHTISDVDGIAMGTPCGSFRMGDGDGKRRHAFQSPPDVYGNFRESSASNHNDLHSHNFQHILGSNLPVQYGQTTKKTANADYSNYMSRRLVAKSCSDSSMEGRSSDSNYTSSSGGGGGSGAINGGERAAAKSNGGNDSCTGISGRFTRQAVNSRFPAMDRMDVNNSYMRVHKPPTYMGGKGAYAQLQQQQINMSSTYPKINYGLTAQQQQQQQQHQQQRKRSQQQQHQRHTPQSTLAQPVVVGTRAMPAMRGGGGGGVYAPDNFRSAENSPKEHNNNNLTPNNNNNMNTDLDGTYTIYTALDNGGATPTVQTTNKANQQQHKQQQQQHINVAPTTATANGRRFVNVEKFVMQSNRTGPTDGEAAVIAATAIADMQQQQSNGSKQATPVSSKSVTYSHKSTASAQSADARSNANGTYEGERDDNNTQAHNTAKEDTTDNSTPIQMGALQDACSDNESRSPTPVKWRSNQDVLQLEDVQDILVGDVVATATNTPLKKNGSLASLHSKSESIKTQIGDTPTVLSRTQSVKSLLIEEDIEEDNSSFVVMDERQSSDRRDHTREASASSKKDEPQAAYISDADDDHICKQTTAPSQPQTPVRSRPQSRARSPTIAEIKLLSRRNSMIKSMESLYERPPSKQELIFDQTSTESGSATSSQLNTTIPIKPQHTPLKQKAKTSHFLKNHRRISPVKQAIKMPQAELYPPTLQRFDKPRDALLKTFDQLDSSNWEIIMLGLKSMVRLMRYHPEQLENQMHMVCIQLTRSVRNLRSQVSRAACQATTELFTLKSKCLEQECDDLVCALLHRTADTNRFLRADATRALESMCDNLTPPKVLNILTTKGALHQNALVRTTAAKLLHRLVERLGGDKVYTMPRENRDKFFVTGANLLLEGSLETRSYAKSIFRLLSDHPQYNRLLIEVIPTRTYRNVEKTLKSIR